MIKITRRLVVLLLGMGLAVHCWSFGADPAPVQVEKYTKAIKLACVGDSITQGPWPTQIGKMLGAKWEVKNFGISGSTLLNAGNKPYQKQEAFKNAKEFNPDVVVIMLGTNDTKPQNWKFKDNFEADYVDMVRQFAELASKPRIYICYPPYIPGIGNWGINEPNILAEIPIIDKVAEITKVGVIDVHGALVGKDALFPDRVHPNAEGSSEIAKAVYKALTGKAPVVAVNKSSDKK